MTNEKVLLIINSVKKLIVAIQALFIYPFLAFPAFAQQGVDPCTNKKAGFSTALCNIGSNIPRTLGNIVVAIVVLAVVIALLYLLYGALRWITSRGDKEQVEAARNHIIAAIVGLIVIFLAIFIISLLLSLLGLKLENLVIPNISV